MTPKKPPKIWIGLALALIVFIPLFPALAGKGLTLTENQTSNWNRFYEEHQTHKLMMDLSARFKPQTLVFQGVNVIPMTGDFILENQTVIIRDGKFSEIGPKGELDIPQEANVITAAAGKFMIPGLTEGHAHTQISLSQYLVYLTRGITTVREMDGFPWMLKARNMAANNELLIPNLYVAGHILSHHAWPFYMTQINTEDQAREVVQAQAEAGYDFIKVHNSMPEPLFSAIAETAHKAGLDFLGHIPNEITIAHAIEMGMRTDEHFKGYIYDEDLSITNQDYVGATAGSDMWNAPSFTNYHEHLRGEEALALAEEENSLRLVPRWMRNAWLKQAEEPVDKLTELRQTIYPKSREIFKNLLPVTTQFFAGTDTGGYAFQVPGYALQEEVRIFEDLGLSPYEALKTATINSAIAMRKETEMGTIEVGKRGDFVILDNNPLEGAENLKTIWGVSVRGTWLHRDALKRIEDALANAFSDAAPIPEATPEVFTALVKEIEALKESGFSYPDYSLEEIENLFRELGFEDLAARIDAIQREPGIPIQTP